MFKGVINTGLRFENDVKMDVKGKSWTDVNFYNALVEGKMEQVTVTFGEMKHTTFRMDTFKVEMRKVEINNVVIDARVLATMIEKSNINSVTTMVSLIDAHRRLEQAQKAITSINEINQKVIDKVGSVR